MNRHHALMGYAAPLLLVISCGSKSHSAAAGAGRTVPQTVITQQAIPATTPPTPEPQTEPTCEALITEHRQAIENDFGAGEMRALLNTVQQDLTHAEVVRLRASSQGEATWHRDGYDPFFDLGNPLHVSFEEAGNALFNRRHGIFAGNTYFRFRDCLSNPDRLITLEDYVVFRRNTPDWVESIVFLRPQVSISRNRSRGSIQAVDPSRFQGRFVKAALIASYHFGSDRNETDIALFPPEDSGETMERIPLDQYVQRLLPDRCQTTAAP